MFSCGALIGDQNPEGEWTDSATKDKDYYSIQGCKYIEWLLQKEYRQ